MKAYIGITDGDWYQLLAAQDQLDEVNFWQPGGSRQFRALSPGELFLFKLHSPRNFIVGGGFFAHSTLIPTSLAWTSFGIGNGAETLPGMRARIEKYRRKPPAPFEDYTIGCILLAQPFFLPESLWIPVPDDWPKNAVQGKTYDLAQEPGRSLWNRLSVALNHLNSANPEKPKMAIDEPRFGKPTIVRPRLGQGSFRVMVTDAYERRCAATGERVLPALEAAHIKPYAEGGAHSVNNGLLLRRDLHSLFDAGYMTLGEGLRIEVSRRIKEDWNNGREYYKLHGSKIRCPASSEHLPGQEFLDWHRECVYRG